MEFKNLPKQVVIREVCSRDGFQGVKEFIPTEKKIEYISHMLDCGLKEMEVTSFVSPRAIPQLKDAAEVLKEVKHRYPHVKMTALVPNPKGAEGALAAGADVLNFVFSASESHNKANMNRTVAESLAGMDAIVELAKGKAEICVSIATSFMCPFEGRIDPHRVAELIGIVKGKGAHCITLAETIGTCNPRDFAETLNVVKSALGDTPTFLHVHDTYGMGLLNIKVALDDGYFRFDSSIGGMGGCPYAPGAAGNIATEDLVFMLEGIGIKTGLDPVSLVKVARELKANNLKTLGHLVASNFATESNSCAR